MPLFVILKELKRLVPIIQELTDPGNTLLQTHLMLCFYSCLRLSC